jgi:hypothetical protein
MSTPAPPPTAPSLSPIELKAVALLLPVAGWLVARYGIKASTATIEAVMTSAFAVLGTLVYIAGIWVTAVRKYGWRHAWPHVEPEILAEVKAVEPVIAPLLHDIKPTVVAPVVVVVPPAGPVTSTTGGPAAAQNAVPPISHQP